MNGSVVSRINLFGEDAESFIEAVFRPTKEQLEQRRNLQKELDTNIKIKENPQGFSAEISGFDLSFLENEDDIVSKVLVVPCNPLKDVFISNSDNDGENAKSSICVSSNASFEFLDGSNEDFIFIAA